MVSDAQRQSLLENTAWHKSTNGASRFEADKSIVERDFPSLKYVTDARGNVALTGLVTVQMDSEHEIFRSAEVKAFFLPDYPVSEPVGLIEPGTFVAHAGKSISDRHIDNNGLCCFYLVSSWNPNDPDALGKWLDNFVLFVHRQFIYDVNGGRWPGPEWKHGDEGRLQLIDETSALIEGKLGSLNLVPAFVAAVIGQPIKRKASCPCGSLKPYDRCHKSFIYDVIREIPKFARSNVAKKLRS